MAGYLLLRLVEGAWVFVGGYPSRPEARRVLKEIRRINRVDRFRIEGAAPAVKK